MNYIGCNKIIIISVFLTLIGQLLFFYGNYSKNFTYLLFGRFIFGIGREVLGIATSTVEALWFRGKELSFAMSVDFSISNIAAFGICVIEPYIYYKTGSLSFTNFIGVMVCIFSVIMSFIAYSLEEKRCQEVAKVEVPNKEKVDLKSGKNKEGLEKISLGDICKLTKEYWLLCLVFALGWFPSYMFARTASDFYQSRYNFDVQTSATIMGLEYLIMAITIPFTGCFVDHFGKHILICIFFTENTSK